MVIVLGYLVVLALMIHGRIAYIRDGTRTVVDHFGTTPKHADRADGACVIGLAKPRFVTKKCHPFHG